MGRTFVALGAISAALAVAAGAFGAHALRARLDERALEVWNTGARYHLVHALGLVVIGVWMEAGGRSGLSTAAGWCLIAGTILFSGSLYGLSLGGPRLLGPVTPLGGLSFMIGWALLAAAALGRR
jgi:uncharacterized membrane protein YgdD (TMEM256/DUF423 family)